MMYIAFNPLTPRNDEHVSSPYNILMFPAKRLWEYSNLSIRSQYLDLTPSSHIWSTRKFVAAIGKNWKSHFSGMVRLITIFLSAVFAGSFYLSAWWFAMTSLHIFLVSCWLCLTSFAYLSLLFVHPLGMPCLVSLFHEVKFALWNLISFKFLDSGKQNLIMKDLEKPFIIKSSEIKTWCFKRKRPTLNIPKDSIPAKLFIY